MLDKLLTNFRKGGLPTVANGKPILNKKNDNAALRLHFANFHQDQINPQLSECYKTTNVFIPYDPSNLDIYKSQWIHNLKAKININNTIFSVM